MNIMTNALQTAGKYVLTDHAKERIRQRIGITAEDAAVAWIKESISNAIKTKDNGRKTHYFSEMYEIICEGVKVITVKPAETSNNYLTKMNEVLTKEVAKLLDKYRRELRKADIEVAQNQLNYLRARNPNTKAIIKRRLADAVDVKALVEDEIRAIEIAARKYGVEV